MNTCERKPWFRAAGLLLLPRASSTASALAASLTCCITPSPGPSDDDADTASDSEEHVLLEFSNEVAEAASLQQPAARTSSDASQSQYFQALSSDGPIPAILGAFDATVNAI